MAIEITNPQIFPSVEPMNTAPMTWDQGKALRTLRIEFDPDTTTRQKASDLIADGLRKVRDGKSR